MGRMLRSPAVVVALKYGVGFALLAAVVAWHWHIDSDGVEVGLSAAWDRPFHGLAFAAAFVIATVSILITFVRWYILVRAQDLPFTLSAAVRLGLIGFYLSTFMPGSVGGDIIKAVAIARGQSRRTVAVATVILDRVIGLAGLFWLVTILGALLDLSGIQANSELTPQARIFLRGILLTMAALSLGSLVFWLTMGFFSEPRSEAMAQRLQRVPRIGMSLAELWRAVWMYRQRGRSVAAALGLSMVSHCGFVLTFYFAAWTLAPAEQVPSLAAHYLIVPVGMTIQAGVPTPGGIGGGEYGYGKLYDLIQYNFAVGTLGSLVQRGIMWILGFIGYLAFLRMRVSHPVVEPDGPTAPVSRSV